MANSKPFILVVEDDQELAQLVTETLEAADMQAMVHHTGGNVVSFLKRNFASLVLLDVGLPDMSGLEVLSSIRRADIPVPVIFLTANDSERDKVEGLEGGADDYVTKPFVSAELIARIHAVLRRTETAYDTKVTRNASLTTEPFAFCSASVNPTRLEITFPGGAVEKIGRKELGIMAYLVQNPHTVQSRKSLIHAVWGVHANIRSRSLDQYIVKIRELLAQHNCGQENFRTVHGVGYIYEPLDPPAEASSTGE